MDNYLKDSLIPSLARLLETETPLSRRIFRSISHFNSAFSDITPALPYIPDVGIYYYQDIIKIATAFEILLNLFSVYSEKKKEELGNRICRLFSDKENIKNQEKDLLWKKLWVNQLYDLRNRIIHGREILPSELDWDYNPCAGSITETAIFVFRLTLMKMMVRKGIHIEQDSDIFQSEKLDFFLSGQIKGLSTERNMDFNWWVCEKKLNSLSNP